MFAQNRVILAATLLLASAGPAAGQHWLETRIAIEEFAENGQIDAAIALSDEFLAGIGAAFGAGSIEQADAQLLLAGVLLSGGETPGAEDSILAAIEIYRLREGSGSPRLIEAVFLLGETYRANREYALALATFEQARALNRRAHGLLNLEQLAILDRMSLTAYQGGDIGEADRLKLEAVTVVQRARGADSSEYFEAKLHYADWLGKIGRYPEAERAYFSLRRVIDDNFDGDPALHVRLLQHTAATLRNLNFDTGTSRSSGYRTKPYELERALRYIARMDEPDPALHASVLRDLGDWFVAVRRYDDVEAAYSSAWTMLEDVDDAELLRREWFAEPVAIRPLPSVPAMTQSRMLGTSLASVGPDAPWGHIALDFTVDALGRAEGIEVVSANPPNLVDGAARRQIADASFRPRMVDGELVAAPGHYEWNYQYDPETAERFASRTGLNSERLGSPDAPDTIH